MTRFIVILGASNLTISLRQILHRAAQSYDGPIDIYLAYGPGRSYGLRAGNPLNQFVGIVRSQLWSDLREAIARAKDPEIYAFITDLGNDLAYTRGYQHLLRWFKRILGWLEDLNASIAVTSLPVDSLQKMPRFKFQAVRRFFFPSIHISREDAMGWIETMQESLLELSRTHNFTLLETKADWYTIDHFHIKFFKRRKVFKQWLDQIWGPPQHDAPLLVSKRQIHAHPLHRYWRWGKEKALQQDGFFITHNTKVFFY